MKKLDHIMRTHIIAQGKSVHLLPTSHSQDMAAILAGINPIHPVDRNGLLRTAERSSAPVGLKQPDIAYLPDREKWQTRSARRLVQHPTLPATPLKEGFPVKYISPLAWEGKDWTDESQWVHNLSTEQLKEIDDAVQHFHGKDTIPFARTFA